MDNLEIRTETQNTGPNEESTRPMPRPPIQTPEDNQNQNKERR